MGLGLEIRPLQYRPAKDGTMTTPTFCCLSFMTLLWPTFYWGREELALRGGCLFKLCITCLRCGPYP